MNILDELFNIIDTDDITTSPFETRELREIFYNFDVLYLEPLEQKGLRTYDKAYLDCANVIKTAEQIAFKVGFKTATQLLTESANSLF